MQPTGPLDVLPVWGVFLATVAVILLTIEGGYRLGRYRRHVSEKEDRPPVGEMVAATLALLAFLLAFVFGLAANRFELRRSMLVDEANAIGTTYLRAAMLPEPARSEVRGLLREYAEARIEATRPGGLERSVERSEALHARLWRHATEVGTANPDSEVVALFIESLNDVIDLHARRMALGVRNRIPTVVWGVLYFLTIIGMAVMGYHAGLSGAGRSLAILALMLAFSAVMALIVDLDRPQEGFLRVSQQTLIDLRRSMGDGPG